MLVVVVAMAVAVLAAVAVVVLDLSQVKKTCTLLRVPVGVLDHK